MPTPQELELLAALDAVESREPAQSRAPSDLRSPVIKQLSPDEEEMLRALDAFEQDIASRPQPGPVDDRSILTQIGDGIDTYSGAASARAAIGTFQDTGSIGQAFDAFKNQYGENPNLAPTGKEIAEKAGFSTESARIPKDPRQLRADAMAMRKPGETVEQAMDRLGRFSEVASPAAVVGFGVDVAADPSMLVAPFVKVAGKFAKGANAALKGSENYNKMTKAAGAVADSGKVAFEATKEAKRNALKLFNPKIADDFNELSDIAASRGIDPKLLNDSIKYGENSVIARQSRAKAEGMLGGDALQKHDELVRQISDATEREIESVSKGARIADDAEAGAIIRQAYDDGVDNFFKQMGETYGNALKMAPDMRLDKNSAKILGSELDKMELWARRRLSKTDDFEKAINNPGAKAKDVNKGTRQMLDVLDSSNEAITKTQRAQADEVFRAVQIAKRALVNSGGSLEQVYQAMRDVGEVAFKSKNSLAEIPSDTRKFQELYFKLQRGMNESIGKSLGDDFLKNLVENNKEMSKHFSDRGPLAAVIGNKNTSDEKVFQALIKNGDTKRIKALFNLISPEAAGQLKASYLDRVLSRNADGVINFAASRKNLNNLRKQGRLGALFSDAEQMQLDEVLRLGDRAGIGVLSTSGTGGSQGFLKGIKDNIENFVAGEVVADGMRKMANRNYVEMPVTSQGGVKYAHMIKKQPAAKGPSSSGFARLKDSFPNGSARAGASGARTNSINERNKKLELLKQRGSK